ncbi:MAG TPA: response regulator, partial [Bryobacteraceae bacterium]|nr:response regulator [Bryobacteraceae bacterium]
AYSLLAILNDVLDLSKIEAGRMAIEVIPFHFCGVIEECVKTHAAMAASKNVAVSAQIDPELPPLIAGDPLRLRQILNNLLSNAVKFTERGRVILRARKVSESEEGRVTTEIRVTDTGIGIPTDKLDLIFEKFTQADSSISRRFGGTGLGLAITRSLIDMHHGSLAVQSVVGQGSTFIVTLTYGLVDEFVPTHERVISGAPSNEPILIVEDNQVNQKLVSALLRKNGYTVTIAGNGSEALQAMERESFRMVLMDVQMPVMDGLEATRRIRRDPRWQLVPIVAMTARAMEGDQQSCLAAGMNGYISKPIHSAHLLSVVEEFTGAPVGVGTYRSPASA